MKKAVSVVGLFIFVISTGWAQRFDLPPLANNVESIKEGFWALVQNAKNIGMVEYAAEWAYSPESITRHYQQYLDNLLANMTYEKAAAYAAAIKSRIDLVDRRNLSKNAEIEFERFLNAAYPNFDFEVDAMMRIFSTRPFPSEIVLNYDRSRLESFDARKTEDENALPEFQDQLAALPAVDILRAELKGVQEELKNPALQRNTRQNNQRRQQLSSEETRIQNQLSQTFIARENLVRRIQTIENNLRNAESSRERITAEIEEPARRTYINTTFMNLYNFYSWEAFFKGESPHIRDYLILNNVRTNLNKIIDELPQRNAQDYQTRVESFLEGWGL